MSFSLFVYFDLISMDLGFYQGNVILDNMEFKVLSGKGLNNGCI